MSDSIANRLRSATATLWRGSEENYQKYRTRDPDDPSARDVHDPHTWDDPDPSIVERLTPSSVAQWLGIAIAMFGIGGFVFYLFPILSPLFRNPLFLAVCIIIAYTLGVWLHGRNSGVQAYKNLDKSIIYYGDDLDVRLGQTAGEVGNELVFEPLRKLGYGGFAKRFLQRRDLPYDVSKLRSKGDSTGQQPVRDRLNTTTETAYTETFGTVHCTHAADMEYDEFGVESDRQTTLPDTMDAGVADQVRTTVTQLETMVDELRTEREMLKQSNADMADLRDSQMVPELERSIRQLAMLSQIMDSRRQTDAEDVENMEEIGDKIDEKIDQEGYR